jgi:hypothetical protein
VSIAAVAAPPSVTGAFVGALPGGVPNGLAVGAVVAKIAFVISIKVEFNPIYMNTQYAIRK